MGQPKVALSPGSIFYILHGTLLPSLSIIDEREDL